MANESKAASFDSQDMPKMAVTRKKTPILPPAEDDSHFGGPESVLPVAKRVAAALADELGFSLFGFDLLARADGRFALIDVNYLPGYKEMTQDGTFHRVLYNVMFLNTFGIGGFVWFCFLFSFLYMNIDVYISFIDI